MNIEREAIRLRKAIRTTIDEELLKAVKKEAIDEGVNVNDVLEELIEKFLAWKSMNDNSIITADGETVLSAISSEIKMQLEKICTDYNLTVTDTLHDFFLNIADAIAQAMFMANYTQKEQEK